MRNVEVAGDDGANFLAQSHQCHRIVDQVTTMHLEAQRHPVISGDLSMLSPIGDQALLPLPLERVAKEREVRECYPTRATVPLGTLGQTCQQRHPTDPSQLHQLARLSKLP